MVNGVSPKKFLQLRDEARDLSQKIIATRVPITLLESSSLSQHVAKLRHIMTPICEYLQVEVFPEVATKDSTLQVENANLNILQQQVHEKFADWKSLYEIHHDIQVYTQNSKNFAALFLQTDTQVAESCNQYIQHKRRFSQLRSAAVAVIIVGIAIALCRISNILIYLHQL